MSPTGPAWAQFRRLLLGSVIEVVHAEGVDVDLSALTWDFEPESGYRFRFVDNWMRFRGVVHAPLRQPVDDAQKTRLEQRFRSLWDELLAAVRTVPMPDPLDATRCEVTVETTDGLTVRFDFEAD